MWNFFTQLKIYIFPIYYRILNKKKTFYIFRKKNPASMLRYSRKIFVQQSLFKIFFYSKLRNMSGKLKKKIFMKPNNLFKFFVNFFTQLKIYIFPIYYSILNKKKTFYIFRKKNRAPCFDIREKILFNNRYFKKKFYSKLHNKVGKLKKKFSWSRITYLNFLWNFFTQLKIYIFPIYYRILNKKKTFYIFRKKNPASMLRYSRKIFVQQSLFKIFYSKLRNMSGKLKKKIFMKPNNLFKFFVKFFYSIKNIYFPDILQHFKQKKNFLYISKKKSSSMLRYSWKNFVQ